MRESVCNRSAATSVVLGGTALPTASSCVIIQGSINQEPIPFCCQWLNANHSHKRGGHAIQQKSQIISMSRPLGWRSDSTFEQCKSYSDSGLGMTRVMSIHP